MFAWIRFPGFHLRVGGTARALPRRTQRFKMQGLLRSLQGVAGAGPKAGMPAALLRA
jgi:hypothetical protein